MATGLMMLLFLFKTKYRRKNDLSNYVYPALLSLLFVAVLGESKNDCNNVQCVHGVCKNGACVCDKGWQGTNCEFCGGRLRLTEKSGFITDGPGNYSFDIQCTWLIETEVPNATLRIRLEHFATECSWDHLYVFDGDSMFAPRIAAYSGLVLQDPKPEDQIIPEVVAASGSAFLHFFSDVAYNMTGFNITYRINSCPQNCSGHGVCVEGVCTCSAFWRGEACNIPICPNECGEGTCNKEGHRCDCNQGYNGLDCKQQEKVGYWLPVPTEFTQPGRASHQAIIHNNSLWIFGGESFQVTQFQILRYYFDTKSWEIITPKGHSPHQRYGHSVVTYKDKSQKAYMYGGVTEDGIVVNELWVYDFHHNTWSLLENRQIVNCIAEPCLPLAAVGHTATAVDDRMLVIFGHSPVYGYLSTVQEYSFSKNEWQLINTSGAVVKGGYGHSSVYDTLTKKIYIHGGYHSLSVSSQMLSSVTYSYDPYLHQWTTLTQSITPRYLHSAAIINGMMLVFAGNTHNDTSRNLGAKCYSTEFLAYDILCDIWYELTPPKNLYVDIARFGHSAVIYEDSMYIYGGFNGRMLNDILRYTPGNCDSYVSNTTCVEAHSGIKCVWNRQKSICEASSHSINKNDYDKCPPKSVNYSTLCDAITLCATCLHTSFDCVWCGNFCSSVHCSKHHLYGYISNGITVLAITPSMVSQPITKSEQCEAAHNSQCHRLHNCHSCQILGNCTWEAEKDCQVKGNQTEKNSKDKNQECSTPCSKQTTCENCTKGNCIWCGVEKRCVESNAYVASFPYGQCMEWTTHPNKCPAHTCSEIKTCELCQENPMCGWCDDGSGTGLGICLDGGSRGPITRSNNKVHVDFSHCPAKHWYFTSCPKCQCNGHSTCAKDTSVCTACQDLTEGPHCEFCISGYYGDPTNGGNCTACECNHHSTSCNRESGKCYCMTKGIIGNHCDRCDEQNHYYGDPRDGGTCFYDLTTDFQFTFNLSKADDKHYNQINFKNTPVRPDIDADFTISCSSNALMNITVKTETKTEKSIYESEQCTNIKRKFAHTEYSFGTDENTTFYVYVYDLQPPMWIQVAFSQQPKLDLLQFFITFSSSIAKVITKAP